MMTTIYFLLFIVLFMGPFIVGQLCEPGMKYHGHSHTCLILVQRREYYGNAVRYCTTMYKDGHIVYIFDRDTDNFIKNFLLGVDDWAYIGLKDNITNGVYRWENGEVAQYFGWISFSHNPSSRKKYVVISKNGWLEDENFDYNFICQKPAGVKESLFLNDSDLAGKTKETDEQTENFLKCKVHTGQPYQTQMFYNNGFDQVLLLSKQGQEISLMIHATSNSSGEYICKIMDLTTKETSEIKGILKVKCKAVFCQQNSTQSLAIPSLNANFKHSFCVQIYPRPSSMILLEASSLKALNSNKYHLEFTYSNDLSTRGELQLTIYQAQKSDVGNYIISIRDRSANINNLSFTITVSAHCPDTLNSQAFGHDTIMLSWPPPHDGVTRQQIIIFKEGTPRDIEMAKVPYLDLSQNVTGLSPGTTYTFYVNVLTEQEVIRCNLTINVTTDEAYTEEQEHSTENNMAAYVVPIVVLIVLIIIAIGVVVIVRQRRTSLGHTHDNKEDKKIILKFSPSYGKASLPDYTEVKKLETHNDSKTIEISVPPTPEAPENIYNNLLENKVKPSIKIAKPLRKSTSSVKFKAKVNNLETGDTQDLKAGGSPTLDDSKVAFTWSDDEGHVYANTQITTTERLMGAPDTADKTKDIQKKDNGRVVSSQGLVYVCVEINPKTLNPKLVEKKEKNDKERKEKKKEEKDKIEKERKEKERDEKEKKEASPSECQLYEEKVEYCSIDYLATSEATLENIDSVED